MDNLVEVLRSDTDIADYADARWAFTSGYISSMVACIIQELPDEQRKLAMKTIQDTLAIRLAARAGVTL